MRGQKGLPKPMEAGEIEMRCPQPDTNADKCHVQERHTVDATIIMVPFFPTISGEYPNYFY